MLILNSLVPAYDMSVHKLDGNVVVLHILAVHFIPPRGLFLFGKSQNFSFNRSLGGDRIHCTQSSHTDRLK